MKINNITNNTLARTLLLCLFAILLSFPYKAAANVDSLRQVWMDADQPDSARFKSILQYYDKKLFTQPDSVILLTAYHIELAQQKNSQRQMALALVRKAIAFRMKGDNDTALIEMKKVADIYSSLNDSVKLVFVYNNLAKIHAHRVEYHEALKYFSKCLIFYQANNKNVKAQTTTLLNIGHIYLEIGNYDLALEYFNKSLQLLEENGEERNLGLVRLNLAKVNLGKKEYDQSIDNCQKAIKIYQSAKNEFNVARCYTFMAKIYQEKKEVDTALVYIRKGLEIHQAIGNDLMILKDQILLANLICNTDLDKAIQIGEEVLKTAGAYQDHSLKIDLYNLLYICYKKKKNYPLSIVMLENYNSYSDSLRIEQDKIAVTKNTIQAEYEAKISNAQLNSEQTRSKLKLNQSIKFYSLLFLASMIILCIIFFTRAKRAIENKEKEVLLNKVNHLEELESTQHRLIQSDKMASLGQLTAGVAHEINNPINFISSGIIGLKKTLNEYIGSAEDEKSEELVEDMNNMIAAIEEGAQRTSNIVKSLRMFSRADTENYVEVNIIQSLESTFTILSNRFIRGVFLEKYFEKLEISMFCYPGQLNQAFMNILLNAIQAVDGAGTVKVEVAEKLENIIITISDNGVGIPDAKKEKIFEPFYTTKSIEEGTGLGLSITADIIKKHNGSIEVKDNEPKGTIFIMNLPIREEHLIT